MSADVECVACGMEATGICGLPRDDAGEFVANDYAGSWAAVPACKGCHAVHKAGGPAALDAHLYATRLLRARVRLALANIANAVHELERAAIAVERAGEV